MSIPQICFTVHGKEICMPIYRAYFFAGGGEIKLPLHDQEVHPPGGPIPGPTPPDPPGPWREIATIAFMDDLAKTLSPDRAKPIQAALRSAIPDLPKGVSVSF